MTSLEIARLRVTVRGSGPRRAAAQRRLVRVARDLLPRALESVMPEMPDRALPSLVVPLDLDPADHDDQTLAILWADRIAHAIASAPPGPAPPRATGEDRRRRATGTDVSPPPVPDDRPSLAALVRRGAGGGRTLPREVLVRLAEPDQVASLLVLLSRVESERLARLLEGWLALAATGSPDAPGRPASDAVPAVLAPRSRLGGGESAATPLGVAERIARAARTLAEAQAPATESAAPAPVRAEASPPPGSGGSPLVTRVGGLALLWPFLPALCEAATARWPDLEAVAVRRAVLARLAGPEDAEPDGDPLILLLAGAGIDEEPPLVAPLPEPDALDPAVAATLSAFADAIPGFAGSSARFVRAEWIRRRGVVAAGRGGCDLWLERRPLDLALRGLPYPLGPVRLAWTPAIRIAWDD